MNLRLQIWILFIALIWAGGCSATPPPDPLAGWKVLYSLDIEKLNPSLKNDYRSYIQKLPPKERERVQMFIDDAHVYEDGNGQHAFRLEVGDGNGTDWAYVAIYDKENKRVKAFKYVCGHYSS